MGKGVEVAEPGLIEPHPAEGGEEAQLGEQVVEGGEAAGAAAAVKAPIYRGIQRDITEVADLGKYALDLERQNLELQARVSGMTAAPAASAPGAPAPTTTGLNYKELGEQMILNPASVVERIENHVRQSVLSAVETRRSSDTFYRSFYEANEDLVGCEDLVEASVARNQAKWKNIPTEQAAKLLAVDVRERAARIRGGAPAADTTQLRSAPAHALQGGQSPAPRVTSGATQASKPLSFAEQLKQQQASRRRSAPQGATKH